MFIIGVICVGLPVATNINLFPQAIPPSGTGRLLGIDYDNSKTNLMGSSLKL
jgi:hypothetical protein